MKTFMEEYGKIVVSAIIIMLFVVTANPIGKYLTIGVQEVISTYTNAMSGETEEGGSGGAGGTGGTEDMEGLNEYGFYYDTKYSAYNFQDEDEMSFYLRENQTVDVYSGSVLIQTFDVTYSDERIDCPSLGIVFSVLSDGKELYSSSMGTLKLGDSVFTEGDYTYLYNAHVDENGWVITVNDKTKTSYGDIKNDKIDGYPLFLSATFNNCTNLTTAPDIPSSVVGMQNAFINCHLLTTAPAIPSSVKNMEGTFDNCWNLTGDIEINANPTDYSGCFNGTSKSITITGSCSAETKAALAGTSNNNNVSY